MKKQLKPSRLAILAWLWITLSSIGLSAAQERSSIHGVLYISYPGDLSFDVMFGKEVEVLLLPGETNLEKQVEAVKVDRLEQIKAQENIATKAHAEARRAVGYEQTKQKKDVLKRESNKFEKLKTEYETELDRLLAQHAIQKTKTDGEGRFRFQALAPGRYLLHARFAVRGVDSSSYFWLLPLDLKAGQETEVQLHKPTAFPLY